jgi:gliding motility-associated-like protein
MKKYSKNLHSLLTPTKRNPLLAALCLLMLFSVNPVKAQSSLYMPAAVNWVSVGDLDVPGDQLTVEALINYTGASVDIVSKHTNPGDVNYLLRIGSFEITTTSGFAAFSGASAAGVTFVPNTMYHVAATYDGATLKYYVNGCLTGQMPWTGTMVQSNLITAIGNMSTCQCEQFIGYIDEVRIWNVARTQAQIAANISTLPSPTTQIGLLGYWNFDGNYINQQGNTAFDGTPIGAPLFQQVPFPYPTALYESVTSSNPVCSGDANGVINVSAVGYYTPYEYSLDGVTFGISPVFSGLNAGTYTVYTRPQNNNSCVVSSPVTITDPAVLSTNLTSTNVSCNGGTNGTANVAPSGGDGPTYHQLWQPSLATSTGITGLAAGNYSVTINDTCKASGAELVTNGHFEDGNTGFTNGYTCCAGGPGFYAVDVSPTYYNSGHFGSGYGGGGNYLIVDGSTTAGTSVWCQSIAVSPNTYYSLSAFVASNYPSVLATVDFTINGISLGTVNAPAATFTWDPFQAVWFSGSSTTASICIYDQNIIAGGNDFGIDNISFKTCLSCIATTSFTITQPTALTVSTVQTNVSCFAGTNGTATVTPNGATPGYTFSWSTAPVQTTATASNLSAGTYTVTVTDLNLCTATTSVTITQPTALSVAITSQTNVSCNAGNNGAAVAAANGGTPGYTYSWNTAPVQAGASASTLTAGTYTVTVADLNTCTSTSSVTITQPTALSVAITAQTNVSCNAGNNGTAVAAANGGTPAYAYSWNTAPVQTGTTASTLTAGTYTVTVTDQNSCTSTAAAIITQPTALGAVISSQTNVSCNGGNNGAATVLANGGVTAYTYSWNTSPVQTTATASSLFAGSYTVTVTDANLCTATTSVTITQSGTLSASISSQTNVSCNGGTNGTATAAGSGGSPAYSYSWNTTPVQTTATASNLSAGTYTVTITDLNLCTATASVTITQPAALVLSLDQSANPSCFGNNDGAIYTTATGGTGAYAYAWTSAVSTTDSALNLTAGSYTITVTDANSCTQSLIVAITDPPVLTLNASASSMSICPGSSTNLTTAVAGGTGIYSYAWSNAAVAATQTVSPLTSTNYTVTVTDAMSCTAIDSVLITVFTPAVIDLGNDTAICQGDAITLDAGSGFSSYVWQNGSIAQTLTASLANVYFVSAIDANGCTVKDTINLTINSLPVIGLSDTLSSCPATTSSLNANAGFSTYAWSNGAVTSSISVNAPGNYIVTVQDANGCINKDSTLVLFYPVPTLVFTVSPLAGCAPLSIFTTNTSLLNGSVIQNWLWQIGPYTSTSSTMETVLTSTGLYNVFLQATTDKGCIVDTLLSNYIEVYPSPAAVIVPESLEYELLDENINLSNQSIGATSYDWSFFNTSIVSPPDLVYPITNFGTYAFQLWVMNQYGCMDSTEVNIVVNPSFAIYFPSAFTPNGNDNNDQFLPKGYGITEYEIMIFDRWGEMVFRSTDMSKGWDGTYKNGLPFPDVYAYRCVIKDLKENLHYYTGAVTLVK